MLKSNSKKTESMKSVLRKKGRLRREEFAEKEGFKAGVRMTDDESGEWMEMVEEAGP